MYVCMQKLTRTFAFMKIAKNGKNRRKKSQHWTPCFHCYLTFQSPVPFLLPVCVCLLSSWFVCLTHRNLGTRRSMLKKGKIWRPDQKKGKFYSAGLQPILRCEERFC
jgi:hypothetical protein